MSDDGTNKIPQIAEHFEQIMGLLSIKTTESNKGTPMRISKMLVNELFKNINGNNIAELNAQMTTFPVEGSTDEPITVEVPFFSMCEHHWLPFYGTVKVSYIPDDRIIGLSKIPRVVDYFSHRPQLQERLTKDIGMYLCSVLEPLSLSVEVVAEHMCVSMRGVKTPCETKTFWTWGVEDNEACEEVFNKAEFKEEK